MENNKQTIRDVLSEKLVDSVRRSTWSELFWFVAKCLACVFLIVSLVDIPLTLETIKKAVFFRDFLLLKIILAILVVFWYKALVSCGRYIAEKLRDSFDYLSERFKEHEEAIESETFAGVPIVELVDYIFENRTFKRSEVEQCLALSRDTIDEIGKRLDELTVFVRGKNNARVLSTDFSRADLVEMFRRAKTPQNLALVRRVTADGSSTYTPRLQEIKKRVLSFMSPSGFTVSPIAKDDE